VDKYSVFVKTDDQGRVIGINSDAFLPSTDGWEKIAEGHGDKFHHAQGNYLDLPLTDENGVFRYELKNGKIKERKKKDMEDDAQARPVQPTDRERIEELERAFEGLNKVFTSIMQKFSVKGE
jgi:hypothetical protein